MTMRFKTACSWYEIDDEGQPGARTEFVPGDEVPQEVFDHASEREMDLDHLIYDDTEDGEDVGVDADSVYAGLTVAELKEQLAERELPLSGTKAELIARLEESDAAHG